MRKDRLQLLAKALEKPYKYFDLGAFSTCAIGMGIKHVSEFRKDKFVLTDYGVTFEGEHDCEATEKFFEITYADFEWLFLDKSYGPNPTQQDVRNRILDFIN